ncbi:MAG: phenylacetate--CoA ligase family protein [Desulfocucumaceae bacterium]
MNEILAKYLYLAIQGVKREPVLSALDKMAETQYWDKNAIAGGQQKSLDKIILWAGKTVLYYKDINIQSILDLPVIKKEDYTNRSESFVSHAFSGKYVEWATSGSSGDPLVVKRSLKSLAYHHASIYRAHGWYGIDIGEREARLWGVPHTAKGRLREGVKDFLMNRIRAAAYELNEEALELFWKRILKWEPSYLFGYSSLMNQMAEYVLQTNKPGTELKLKAVICTSETLTGQFRLNISKAFNCPVVGEYGCTETGIIAYECPSGGFHISSEAVFVELLPSDIEGLKKVVVTDLHNYAMPIIRYDIGDLAAWDETPCPCGRQLPKLKNITGRESSILVTPEGKKIHTIVFYYALCDLKGGGINKFQVARKGDFKYLFRLVPGIGFRKDNMDFIITKVTEILGKNTMVEFEIVNDIPRTAAGKFRDFVDERITK